MSITPLKFAGVSSLSEDLQAVMNRAVAIASLPLQQLQRADADILQKESLLGSMSPAVMGLANAISNVGSVAATKALNASSSDSSVVSVTYAGAAVPGVYKLSTINSIATLASETSLASWADATKDTVSLNGSMKLTAGGQDYRFTLTKNTLVGLRDQINGLGAGVNASILTSSGRAYLTVTAANLGQNAISLVDDPTPVPDDLLPHQNTAFLTSGHAGSNADFMLNDTIHVVQSSNTMNSIVPGMTFTLLAKPANGTVVNLTLSSDRSQLATALEDFATKYNTVVGHLDAQVGPAAGLLSGDYLIRAIQQDLRSVSGYSAGGTVTNLAEVGLEFDQFGRISFDEDVFNTLSESEVTAAFTFFGSPTTGFGALSAKFKSMGDPISGLIKTQQDGYAAADRNLQSQIALMEDRINEMQLTLASKLEKADALLAMLESQQTILDASLKGANLVMFGKNDN